MILSLSLKISNIRILRQRSYPTASASCSRPLTTGVLSSSLNIDSEELHETAKGGRWLRLTQPLALCCTDLNSLNLGPNGPYPHELQLVKMCGPKHIYIGISNYTPSTMHIKTASETQHCENSYIYVWTCRLTLQVQ